MPCRPKAVGLLPKRETIEVAGIHGGVEMDLVTHDVRKVFMMLLKRTATCWNSFFTTRCAEIGPT
jgi:hypothetical protein